MGNVWDAFEFAFAKFKDSLSEQLKYDIRKSYLQLLETEAQSRRKKMSEEIISMAKLKIALEKFETTYNDFKNHYGSISEVDNWINPIKREIALKSLNKNRRLR